MANPKLGKKLIEVALPLEAINKASAREKSIRHGHPSTLHLWWARRPLATARAVIFAQMVDDPSAYVDTLRSDPRLLRKAESILKARKKVWEEAKSVAALAAASRIVAPPPGPEPELDEILAEQERERLFRIIEELVLWENTNNPEVLKKANMEIWQSWRRACSLNADHPKAKELFNRAKLPAFHDPFAGGGALPLEAQRLGLDSYASDLNPVPVLINKAIIEIPSKFAGKPPINPEVRKDKTLFEKKWDGAQGLAEDVRYYGRWMRDEAEKRIGQLYPKVEITAEMASERQDLKPYIGKSLTVIAWLWARTVKSPNPAFAHTDVPLISTYILSTKPGREAYVVPIVKGNTYHFEVRMGKPPKGAENGTKLGRGANFKCVLSDAPIDGKYIREEFRGRRNGNRLMAIVVDGGRMRIYLPPIEEHERIANQAKPQWKPEVEMNQESRDLVSGRGYGFKFWHELFTQRQLVTLTTLSDLVQDTIRKAKTDASSSGIYLESTGLALGGIGAEAYAESIGVYLGLAVSKVSDAQSSFCRWKPTMDQSIGTFGRQALPMVWDYSEANAFGGMAGDFVVSLNNMMRVLDSTVCYGFGEATQQDAQTQTISSQKVISTDPPYYDNIAYADLSDYFYIWLRRSLQSIFPGLYSTMAVPKNEELVATTYRHGTKEKAEVFFLNGMTQAMHRLAEQAHPAFPVTIYYAFKQSEAEGDDGAASTGWETFLDAVIHAGFSISGTWPMRTELANKVSGIDRNMLASSIVIVCRKLIPSTPTATRREFIIALQTELPAALSHLQAGNIAPVDLAQSAIGPGIAIYTRYSKVLDAEGNALSVRAALALINQTLGEVLAEQEGDFDPDTRWALAWFDQFGFAEAEYGIAETLSKAKNTSVAGMVGAGIVESAAGKVRLFKPTELHAGWDPIIDKRLTVWEIVHHLIRVLEADGESATATLAAKLGAKAEIARELAYRLYSMCERKKRAQEALSYNALVQSWPEISRMAKETIAAQPTQTTLFNQGE